MSKPRRRRGVETSKGSTDPPPPPTEEDDKHRRGRGRRGGRNERFVMKELPVLFLGGFFALVFSVIGLVYRKYGITMFVDRSYFDLNRNASEWRSLLDGGGVGGASEEAAKTVLLIGGPHRGGTTIVWRAICAHPDISGLGTTFETGGDYSEGILIQDVYSTFGVGMEKVMKSNPGWQKEMRGLGKYALGDEEKVHLTEKDGMVTPSNLARIMNRFGYYWDLSKPVLVEKSPPTAVMSRFLQALYNVDGDGEREKKKRKSVTKFLFVTRHPVANAYAHQRILGGTNVVPLDTLYRNYVSLHRYMKTDLPRLDNDPRILRLEDFASDPASELTSLYRWLGVDHSADTVRRVLRSDGLGGRIRPDPNARYHDMWCGGGSGPPRSGEKKKAGRDEVQTAERYQKDVDELGLGYDIIGWCGDEERTAG